MVPGHGPGTRAKCFALSATKNTPAEEQRPYGPALATIEGTWLPRGSVNDVFGLLSQLGE
jgi:hypothetical protein